MSWQETFEGGGAKTEQVAFKALADDIMHAQLKARRAAGGAALMVAVDRAFHAKPLLAVDKAELHFRPDLPNDLASGFVQANARYPVIVRISNAANRPGPDTAPDMRGIALRVQLSSGEQHDLLATNYPVSHARNARQFVRFAVATAGGTVSRLIGIAGLCFSEGPFETLRMLRNVSEARRRIKSVALESYWSRGAMRWGPTLAVRFLLRPASPAALAGQDFSADPEGLSKEAAARLAAGPIQFELCVQRFVDDRATPIEDTSIPWRPEAAPIEMVATLTVPKQDVNTPAARDAFRIINALAFNPWNTTDEFSPLGNLNRARKNVYDASAAHRLQTRWREEPPLRNRVFSSISGAVFKLLNRRIDWYQLPLRTSLLNLDANRQVLRRYNLIDTEPAEAPPVARAVPGEPPEEVRTARTFDGQWNDLSAPKMGAVGATFGRNIKPDFTQSLEDPNPILVARALLDRKTFLPARSLNLLAAAWIQFQVHDWVDHARKKLGEQDVQVPLPDGSPGWVNVVDGEPEPVMRIAGNVSLDGDGQHLFGNATSHWWDGSEVYGSDATAAAALREGAKIRLENGYLPVDRLGMEVTGFNKSFWLGLSALHTLFVREHNLLCDELRAHYRGWSDDRIYHTARLIVTALIAKIHTVEWTPAILATQPIDVGLGGNWHGPPANDWMTKLGIWLIDVHAATGIPQTKPDHHGAPFCLTEDFATVYRLHPLLPDDYAFYNYTDGTALGSCGFLDIQGASADKKIRELGLHNLLYSFGIAHPGAITLHNFPRSLQAFERDGERIDLSVVDIIRTRRRGVPRYNAFRTGLHKAPITRWEDMSADAETVRVMRDLYRNDINAVDTMIGLFAETCPPGFGFSDTAFRIFILMASRRLQSDRFLTVDFRPEIYSPFGMDWIAQNGMTSLILRHCPELAGSMPRGASAFAPWRVVTG
jgi:heme peroxidase